MPSSEHEERSTKERILDAAEALFAERGFAGASLRLVTAEAGVNLAAVNYHFGSKEALIRAVFERRLGPLNRERLALLDRAERAAGDAPPPLERVVEAFIGPAVRMCGDPRGATFMRLVGYTYSQLNEPIGRMFYEQFREVAERFHVALTRVLPRLGPDEVLWRLVFMVGAMAHTMAISERLPTISEGRLDASDVNALITRLTPFVVAGLAAPAPALQAGRRR